MVNDHLVRHLECNDFISDRQYAVWKNRGIRNLTFYLVEKWSRAIRHFSESKVVALNISKAFDMTWHDTLVSKWIAIGVNESLTPFISNPCDESCNRCIYLKQIPPQGSALSTSLFLMFIDDLLRV